MEQRRKTTETPRKERQSLSEADWIQAATEILVEENVKGIRVEALAKTMGVTKGSFYWHFQTRAELLSAVLASWRRRMTLNIMRSIQASGRAGYEGIRELISLPRRPGSARYGRIEASIRDWGRRARIAREAVDEVDQLRFEFLTQLFEDEGLGADVARRRAYIAYCIMMGDATLHETLDALEYSEFVEEAVALLKVDRRSG
jgi:AcrR family transcriptional regulator